MTHFYGFWTENNSVLFLMKRTVQAGPGRIAEGERGLSNNVGGQFEVICSARTQKSFPLIGEAIRPVTYVSTGDSDRVKQPSQ